MGMIVALQHTTSYQYDRLISLGPQVVRLKPAPHCRTPVHSYSLKITPDKHFLNWQQDPFGNYLARAVFPEKVKQLHVEVGLTAEIRVFNPFDFFLEDSAKHFPFSYDAALKAELTPYLEIKEAGPLLKKFVSSIKSNREAPLIDFLIDINQRLEKELSYLIRMEPGVQTCEQTLSLKSGSCRDMAWLLCQVLRHLGLATRFCSGYLIQLVADVKSLDGPSGTTEDFTDLHAWTEVFLPGAGWVGFDPTSGLLTGEGHLPLCCTPNPSSAAPISGALDPCEATMEHHMKVTRIHEDPRITKPYSEQQWRAIDQLGRQLDQDLMRHDVRLTMGGEPTFVSIDDRESSEWQLEALGPQKKALSQTLFKRLQEIYGKHGLVHHGQGKWYPGEILPRWSMNCYWRKDGQAIWQDPSLMSGEAADKAQTSKDALRFAKSLAKHLSVPSEGILPAFEDTPYYLWKEGQLPVEGDILKASLYEATERRRLQSLLYKGLDTPAGYVLPIKYSFSREQWITNRWQFRTEHLLLNPGDSPIGLRLPTQNLPFVSQDQIDVDPTPNPFAPLEDLDPWDKLAKAAKSRRDRSEKEAKYPYFEADPVGKVRTALCLEVRDGVLNVFLPPVSLIEPFLDLICSLELAAKETSLKICIEGYPPPHDLRIESFKITPDPGVIEVNVQPSKTWDELNQLTNHVYEQARLSRLTAEKFLIDGQRVGTGGGNHIVLGGETPADSPFLRRPDLLRSLLTFWQNHPSLSYLFSSLFIGPTSQAPRIDEARHDSLYELELAFSKLPPAHETIPFWLIDRVFRNILVDMTGNTHRTEFCIDKLFTPDSEAGRLGLVEMRGFEMPPHPQMSLVQALLIRACIAKFWQKPCVEKLVRWHNQLHDRFMLPYYVWNDFEDVVSQINRDGYPIQLDWFRAHFEFRFPIIGQINVQGIHIEFRVALEPWHVLGEESYQGTVSRAVDSSVQRLQVTVSGDLRPHHVLTCNRKEVPLQPCKEEGTFVAGVRYKAWMPPHGLHPTVPVHTPLVFDLVDSRCQQSLGSCTIHAAHPGGRNYDTVPVNENEAEGRRLARFQAMGQHVGEIFVEPNISRPEFPCTLDLRFS